LQYSPRGVLATQLCSTLKPAFNDQMGIIIDKIWMVKSFYNFSFLTIKINFFKNIELVNYIEFECRTKRNVLLGEFLFASKYIQKNESNYGQNFHRDVENCRNGTFCCWWRTNGCILHSRHLRSNKHHKCLHDDCIEVFNYKDSLTKHQTNTKFALRPATFIPMANSVRLQQQQCGK